MCIRDSVKTTKFPEKLPTYDRICKIYSLDASDIDGISQGKPVKKFALQYSIKDKLMIINKIGDLVFGVNNLAITNAKAQNNASMQGKIITDKGIR